MNARQRHAHLNLQRLVDACEDGEICSGCNGSGEGWHDGAACAVCGGLGEVEARPSDEEACDEA